MMQMMLTSRSLVMVLLIAGTFAQYLLVRLIEQTAMRLYIPEFKSLSNQSTGLGRFRQGTERETSS
jgi:hypothetical protein